MQKTSKHLSPWQLPDDLRHDPIPQTTHPFFHSPIPTPSKPNRLKKPKLQKNHTQVLRRQRSEAPRKITINFSLNEQTVKEKPVKPREEVQLRKIGVETLVRQNSQFVVGLRKSQQAMVEFKDMLDDLVVLKMIREQLKRQKVQGTSQRINQQFEVLFPLIGMAAGKVNVKRTRRGMSQVLIRHIQ